MKSQDGNLKVESVSFTRKRVEPPSEDNGEKDSESFETEDEEVEDPPSGPSYSTLWTLLELDSKRFYLPVEFIFKIM